MGRIPQHFLDDLLSRTDLVALVDARVHLKKAGRDYSACCPFHDEKTPSFTVSPAKQFYHCFGCGAHGNALGFLMEYERLEFLDAVDELAGMAGVEIPREYAPAQPAASHGGQLELLARVTRFYRHSLPDHPESVEYLKGRGLDREMVNRFLVGYAPPGWSNVRDRIRDDEALLDAGLLIRREGGGAYDRFRNRIVFPIRDMRGRVIAFGGRAMGDDQPKYLNSPETTLFHKGRNLYGLYEARQAMKDLPRLLVVEGYMDVIALAQAGLPYAVATLGTATTEQHLETLFRHTDQVVFFFDGDRAGQEAARRALERAAGVMRDGREIRFLFLPEEEDPDSLVRNSGREALEALVEQARPLSDFLLDTLADGLDTASLDGRAHLVERARPYMERLSAGAFRTLLMEQLARRAHLPKTELENLFTSGETANATLQRQRPRNPAGLTPVRRALQLLLENPELSQKPGELDSLRNSHTAGVSLLVDVIELLLRNPHFNAGTIMEHWREREDGRHLARLAAMTLPVPEEGMEREYQDALERLRVYGRRQRVDALLSQAEQGGLEEAEQKELNELLSRH